MGTDLEILEQAVETGDLTGVIAAILLLTCVIVAQRIVDYFWTKRPKVETSKQLVAIWRQIDPTRNDNMASDIKKVRECVDTEKRTKK